MSDRPRVVLLCEDAAAMDRLGLASWLACSTRLVGMVTLQDRPARRWRSLCAERRRTGLVGVIDTIAFRLFYGLGPQRARDRAWERAAVADLSERYPADLSTVPQVTALDVNGQEVRAFLTAAAPDIVIARCKRLLAREIFEIPRAGTFVLHPGICPEYRNAHGCFWAMATRDLDRVGMTMLRVDAGVDTGRVFLQTSYPFDEQSESHVVIQHRVVVENLDAIARVLREVADGVATPIDTSGRRSAVWGQPRLSAYVAWRRAVRRDRHASTRFPALS